MALRRQRRARIVRLPTLAALVVVLALASATHLVAATAVAEDVLAVAGATADGVTLAARLPCAAQSASWSIKLRG